MTPGRGWKRTVNRNKFLRRLYDLSKKVLNIVPFYLFLEGFSDESLLNIKPDLEPCETAWLGPSDMKAISVHPEVPESEEALLKRLSQGYIALGIKHHHEIISYMWCNLQECDSNYIKFKLKKDEAYLTYARTFNAYRGRNLAPYLRLEFYRQLKKMGRVKILSISDYFNEPALRFKEKLKAQPVKLYVTITFFGKSRRTIPLRSYVLRKA